MKLSTILAILPAALAAPTPPEILPRDGTPIAGRYIVKFRNLLGIDFDTLIQPALQLLKVDPTHLYNFEGFGGLAGEMSDDVVRLMRLLPIVEFVEQDQVVRANLGEVVEIEQRAYTTQSSAVWGLSRISSKTPGTNNYVYDNSAGSGSCAYVIDTGIDVSHPEFEGRATFLANYAGDDDDTDGNGHGTHVAGIVGSKTYGVAKNVRLFAVKVLDANGSGTSSNLIAGINYAANDARSRGCTSYVANLSLGGAYSAAVNSASANAVSSGLFMSVAAGNEAVDAKNSSPASESNVFTVGATDASDTFASFSNYGSFVDILAPGDRILSTYNQNRLAYLSGTSMAAPHVAGLAAYLQAFEGKRSASGLSSRIRSLGLRNVVSGVPSGTPNLLAFNGNPRG